MATKRTPLHRCARRPITAEAVAAFRQMETAESNNEWWHWHNVLHDALGGLALWDWPCVEDPSWTNPYPPGCNAAQRWQRDRDARPEAFELYHALKAAATAVEKG